MKLIKQEFLTGERALFMAKDMEISPVILDLFVSISLYHTFFCPSNLGRRQNKYLERLNDHNLLIIDDLGIERDTEYALEQVYNIIDTRYKSGKPLIITTNLTLEELKNPIDAAHKRIYDRVLGMCVPVMFNGSNFRNQEAANKMETARKLFGTEDKK